MHDMRGPVVPIFVSLFTGAEGDDASGRVPASLTESITPFLRCMAGTNQKQPHCKALIGVPGRKCQLRHL
ncbi:Ferredoxin [Salmonella enterica subsp. arizonae]|uniref:Ferredoxin n=1 Tax=Salmonella enterica subsp. arizonae TaxID=59203 RepID=A0A379S2U3_SALER|nr:Ferredoxin [Salmonella enterica subsp. arizonae]